MTGCWSTPAAVQQPIEPSPPVETAPAAAYRARPKGPSHCERAIDHVMIVMQPAIDNAGLNGKTQLLRDAALESCTVTAWTEDTMTCYDNIADTGGITTCHAMLSPDQRKDLDQRMGDAIRSP